MTITDEAASPPASDDAEALFPEARRRRRRIRSTMGVGGLLLVAAVVIPLVWVSGWVGGGSVAPGSSLSAITSADVLARNPPDALLVWDGANEKRLGGFEVGDPTNGRVRSIPGPPGHYSCLLACIARIGSELFAGSPGGVYRLGWPSGAPTRIGDGQLVFPSPLKSELYVATTTDQSSPGQTAGGTVSLLSNGGTIVGGPWTVPSGYALTYPPRSTASGIVVEKVIAAPIGPSASLTAAPTLAIWNPRTGSIGHVLDLGAGLIDTTTADGHTTVAWLRALRGHCFYPRGDCQLVLTDLTTGLDRVIAPTGSLGFLGGGAFSPDGTKIAAFIHPGHILGPGLNGQVMKLVIVDVATGIVRPVPGSIAEYGEPYGFATWSPDGRWVFFGGFSQPGGEVLHHVGAYRIGTTRATELGLPQDYSVVAGQP
jgi:WD40-like Beta Propeller Repeat